MKEKEHETMRENRKEKLMLVGYQERDIVLNFEYNTNKQGFVANEQIEGVRGCKIFERRQQAQGHSG